MKKQLTMILVGLLLSIPFAKGQNDTKSTRTYIKELDSIYQKDQPKAFTTLEKYLKERGETSFSVAALDEIYYGLAKYSSRAYDFENSKQYAKKGITLLEKNNIVKGKAGYYNLLGGVTYFDNKLDSAAYYFIQSLKAIEADGQLEKLPFINNNIANIYSEQEDPQKALKYYKDAYEQLKKLKQDANSKLLASVAGNLSYTYYQVDSLENAKIFANKSLQLSKEYNDVQGSAIAYNVKSILAGLESKPDSAYYYLKKGFDIATQENNSYQIAFTASNLSKLLSESNPMASIKYGEIAYKKNGDGKKGKMLYKNIRSLGTAYFNIGDYKKAAEFQKQYISYQDSIFKEDYNQKTIDVLEKYQAAEKELKIIQQEAEITKKENQNKLIAILTVGLALLSTLLFLFFRQRQKTQKQQIATLENERENIALRSLITGEEKERSRIAKELHDGLGGILAVSKMHTSKLLSQQPETKELTKISELIDTAAKESRRISHNLLPENLLQKGLDAALTDFISSVKESHLLDASYQSINISKSLPQSFQLSVYRIVQELMNNIIKHSEATEALVQLHQDDGKLTITVEDNGKGFSNEQVSEGIGLSNIKSRLSLLKGSFAIDSTASNGTSVFIELQLEK